MSSSTQFPNLQGLSTSHLKTRNLSCLMHQHNFMLNNSNLRTFSIPKPHILSLLIVCQHPNFQHNHNQIQRNLAYKASYESMAFGWHCYFCPPLNVYTIMYCLLAQYMFPFIHTSLQRVHVMHWLTRGTLCSCGATYIKPKYMQMET